MDIALIIATSVIRLAAAWLALRLYRRTSEKRFATVAFVLAVTAAFPLIETLGSGAADGLLPAPLTQLAAGLAVLFTALILVRTLTELHQAFDGLSLANEKLEQRVEERTAELREANRNLESEISVRKQAEEALRAKEAALTRSEAELRALAGRLIAAQEDERRRLARELHDDLSQTLAALALELAKLQSRDRQLPDAVRAGLEIAELRVNKLADDIHDMSRLLHPSILDDLGLAAAIRAECERFSEREGVPVKAQIDSSSSELPADVALTLYRITQESLRNVAKHAEAGDVEVTLDASDKEVTLSVSDTGKGFDYERAREEAGLGLVSMSERVRLLSGKLDVRSAPDMGARIEVRIPLGKEDHEPSHSLIG
jgi:signal transduction histidine kinase